MIKDVFIIDELVRQYGNDIKRSDTLPKSYPEKVDPLKVKAIYLGCDPTNTKYNIEFEYVFALGHTPKEYKRFRTFHTNQLKAISLTWDDVFAQNLCRNYFHTETKDNIKIWNKVAKDFWIEKLKEELTEKNIPKNIPVLLTSKYLFDILVTNETIKSTAAQDFYENPLKIPIHAKDNLLSRPLIPVYRGGNPKLEYSYSLSNRHWESYCRRAIELIHDISKYE